ncbi:MAG: hypothetical protein J0H68_06270 [Sphingobacteriia bacterium]|nr:hypothetical protein [Sphingobacteriia bacterium]
MSKTHIDLYKWTSTQEYLQNEELSIDVQEDNQNRLLYFTNLRSLRLHYSDYKLSNFPSYPFYFTNLLALTKLDNLNLRIFSKKGFNQTVLQSLTNLTSLEYYFYHSRNFPYITGLTKLRELSLKFECNSYDKNDHISNLSNISYLTQLTSLRISRTQGKSINLDLFKNLTRLKELALDSFYTNININRFILPPHLTSFEANCGSFENIDNISSLVKLEKLKLNAYIKSYHLKSLTNLSSLRELHLDFFARGIDCKDIPNFPNLTSLELVSNNDRVKNLSYISKFNNLVHLYCRNIQFNLKFLVKFTHLKSLDLYECALTETNVLNKLHTLTILKIRDLTLSRKSLNIFNINHVTALTNLVELDLSGSVVHNLPEIFKLFNLKLLSLLGSDIKTSQEKCLSIKEDLKNKNVKVLYGLFTSFDEESKSEKIKTDIKLHYAPRILIKVFSFVSLSLVLYYFTNLSGSKNNEQQDFGNTNNYNINNDQTQNFREFCENVINKTLEHFKS